MAHTKLIKEILNKVCKSKQKIKILRPRNICSVSLKLIYDKGNPKFYVHNRIASPKVYFKKH